LKKLKVYIQKNWKWVATAIVIGQCFSFWLVPLIFAKSWVKSLFALEISLSFFLFVSISFLFLLLTYKPALDFYRRYKNNFTLKEIPFTYIDSVFLFFASSIFTISIFHERILGDISLSSPVKIWLIAFCIFLLIWYGIIRHKGLSFKTFPSQQHKELHTADSFPDEPITHESEDLLDRKQFVEDFYNQIIKYPFPDSFVFGLYGTWGEGKTSVLNLLKNKLYQNDDVIVFEFDPWYFSSQDALIKGFYEGLYAALNKRFFLPNIKRLFSRYHRILSAGLKLSGINIDVGLSQESLEDLKEEIQRWISLTGKKVVILIDDVDRLQDKDEILQIFKIVKLSGRFKNTIFVMTFDPNIISSYLENVVSVDPSFLDKIVQSPVRLSAIDQAMIDRFLFYSFPDQGHISAIDRLFQKLEIDQERVKAFDKDFIYLYEAQIKRLFPTFRYAKRYLNGLYSTLPVIKNEINLQDFLVLELIRIFYPEVYEDIWEHPWYYIPSGWSEKMYILSPFGLGFNEDQKYEKIREHITKIVDRQDKSEVLLELLKVIFFVEVKNAFGTKTGHDNVSHTYRAEKKITHPDVFPKYFMLKVPSTELPDETVESLISIWDNTESTTLESKIIEDLKKFLQEKKLLELLNKLIIFLPRFTPNVAKSLIRSLYKNINLFPKEGRKDFWRSEFDRAKSLMLHLINEKIENTEIESILKEIINETPSFELAVGVVLSCRRERGGSLFNIYENIEIDKLQKILSERLSHYFIEGGKDIFEEEKDTYSFILYQWGTASPEDREKVNNYVFSLIEKNPKYLGKILSGFIIMGDQIQYSELTKLYDVNRLYQVVKEHYSNTYSDPKEKSAIDLFIKVYEEEQKSALEKTRQEANKQRFVNTLNKGHDYFTSGKFSEALQEFNRAMAIKDWEDKHDLTSRVKYEKWKCFLELAWNKGEPIKEHFDEACKLAGNEAQIKSLIDSAYKGGHPDRSPIELYFCLFYYLYWHFAKEAKEDEKSFAKEQFMVHYQLATGSGVSGKSEEITKRCEELLNRINSNV